MNRWDFNNDYKKKVRGLKRRKKTLINSISDITEQMPNPSEYGLGYWHLHLPFAQSYINSSKLRNRFRREIMQILINRVSYLKNIKTQAQAEYRVYDKWQKNAPYFNEGMNFARYYYFFERYELKSRVYYLIMKYRIYVRRC